jgi:hypothetical protein
LVKHDAKKRIISNHLEPSTIMAEHDAKGLHALKMDPGIIMELLEKEDPVFLEQLAGHNCIKMMGATTPMEKWDLLSVTAVDEVLAVIGGDRLHARLGGMDKTAKYQLLVNLIARTADTMLPRKPAADEIVSFMKDRARELGLMTVLPELRPDGDEEDEDEDEDEDEKVDGDEEILPDAAAAKYSEYIMTAEKLRNPDLMTDAEILQLWQPLVQGTVGEKLRNPNWKKLPMESEPAVGNTGIVGAGDIWREGTAVKLGDALEYRSTSTGEGLPALVSSFDGDLLNLTVKRGASRDRIRPLQSGFYKRVATGITRVEASAVDPQRMSEMQQPAQKEMGCSAFDATPMVEKVLGSFVQPAKPEPTPPPGLQKCTRGSTEEFMLKQARIQAGLPRHEEGDLYYAVRYVDWQGNMTGFKGSTWSPQENRWLHVHLVDDQLVAPQVNERPGPASSVGRLAPLPSERPGPASSVEEALLSSLTQVGPGNPLIVEVGPLDAQQPASSSGQEVNPLNAGQLIERLTRY